MQKKSRRKELLIEQVGCIFLLMKCSTISVFFGEKRGGVGRRKDMSRQKVLSHDYSLDSVFDGSRLEETGQEEIRLLLYARGPILCNFCVGFYKNKPKWHN